VAQPLQYLALTVSAVRDQMAEALRAALNGAPPDQTARALQLGIQEIELLWDELQQQAEEFRRQREHYAAFFDSAQDACLITDMLGIIREANRSAAVLLGISPEGLRGRSFDGLQSRFVELELVLCPGQQPGDAPTHLCWLIRPRARAAA
jgi:PAS domain-containing protein